MNKAELTRFPGVLKRHDSNVYQFGLRVPKDLQHHFAGDWAVRCSLRTADLREANDKAKALHAEWAQRFDAMRSGKPAAPVDLAALRAKLLAYAQDKYLPAVDRLSAGYTRRGARGARSHRRTGSRGSLARDRTRVHGRDCRALATGRAARAVCACDRS